MHRMAQGVEARVFEKSAHPHLITCLIVRCLSANWSLLLSLECLYILSNLFTSFILLILHVVGTAEHKNLCAPAEWGVLPCGDTQPSHMLQLTRSSHWWGWSRARLRSQQNNYSQIDCRRRPGQDCAHSPGRIEAANFAQLWSRDYHDGTLLRSQAVTNFLRPSGSQDVSFPGNWWKTFYSLKQRLLPSASAHRLIVMFSSPMSLRRTPVSHSTSKGGPRENRSGSARRSGTRTFRNG